MRKNEAKKWLLLALLLLLAIAGIRRFQKNKQVICGINDGTVSWESVETVNLYFTGMEQPPTLVLTDASEVEQLVHEVTNISGYTGVRPSEYLEGLCGCWVVFDNGICVNLYNNVNYGCITTEKTPTGKPPFYHFPRGFWEKVMELKTCGVSESGENSRR